MLVVLVVVDVIADVVKKRRVRQRLPLFRVTADSRTDGIEQSESQLLNLARVELLVVRSLRELAH